VLAAAFLATPCVAQLRVAQWNITSYTSGRVSEFQTAIYGSFGGRSMSPDVIVAEEINGEAGAVNFLALLNGAPGSPGDWALAPFVPNSGDSSNALYYRTSRVAYLSVRTLDEGTGAGPDMPPRDNQRWRVRLSAYASPGAELYIYSAHMKAGSNASDRQRRTPEAHRIRDDAETLPLGANFLLAGDFNMQSWNEEAYQIFVGPEPTSTGRFVDPIKSPGYVSPSPGGSWNGNQAYRFIHTQDPATCDAGCADADCSGGGMDDRHDQIIVSPALVNGNALDYVGNADIPYSTSTWNDPNHSYRAWGNDGTSFNCRLRIAGNTMVGPVIARALIDSALGLGHLPVFLDLQVPARVDAPDVIDFGTVTIGEAAVRSLVVANSADILLWSREGNGSGVDDLEYTLVASTGFGVPTGLFAALPGVPGNAHAVTMNTSAAGDLSGTLTILSDDPDHPVHVVALVGRVVEPACACDWNNDHLVDSLDFFEFLTDFFHVDADFNADGTTDSRDFFEFLACFYAGC
jgi:hypothetical protein